MAPLGVVDHIGVVESDLLAIGDNGRM